MCWWKWGLLEEGWAWGSLEGCVHAAGFFVSPFLVSGRWAAVLQRSPHFHQDASVLEPGNLGRSSWNYNQVKHFLGFLATTLLYGWMHSRIPLWLWTQLQMQSWASLRRSTHRKGYSWIKVTHCLCCSSYSSKTAWVPPAGAHWVDQQPFPSR